MLLFAASIFLSAFLLFQIQPMIGKFVLPWFGGTPAVWSTLMLFFQLLLTGGYAYAYWLVGKVKVKQQPIVHILLVALSISLLILFSFLWQSPITPDSSWKPQDVSAPVLHIFRLLAVSIGLPYFILAANGPLMQAWFSHLFPERSYARLYALSNAGSLLGLLTYPILIEPTFSLREQGWIWSGGFAAFALLAVWVAMRSWLAPSRPQPQVKLAPRPIAASPSTAQMVLWIALSGTASLFLLSVTNQISQEVAVIPFLWILPLALYLLSFMLTFSGEGGYQSRLYAVLFPVASAVVLFVMLNATSIQFTWQILAYCLLLFSACMLCHAELYRLRPPARYLTTYYLMISVGGAIGGIFVSLIAPAIFGGYWELFVALGTTVALWLTVIRRDRGNSIRARFIVTTFGLVTLTLAVLSTSFSGALYGRRNFYGVIRVHELSLEGSTEIAYVMSHGITVHGLQFSEPELRHKPTTYYVEQSGVGLAILNHPKYGGRMRVGLLGLGIGTLAAYAQAGDEYRLYEINPVVIELAKGQGNYFSFLSDSQAEITTVLGDARISLERELAEGKPGEFDVLVLDTFSSDSIPVHLVTEEAFALYLDHLAPGGVIAAHVTNLHLDLQPVFWQLARHHGLSMVRMDYPGDSAGGYASQWILLAREQSILEIPSIQARAVSLDGYSTDIRLWTDNYSNMFQIVK